jgi:hypothetical protein
MTRMVMFVVACVHGVLLFHVLRSEFTYFRRRKTFAGRGPDFRERIAWEQAHEWDLVPVLIAGLCSVVDVYLMVLMITSGLMLSFIALIYGFVGLFFLAYLTTGSHISFAHRDRSPIAPADIAELRKGHPVDLTGTWLVRGKKEWDHDYVDRVEAVVLEPALRQLSVRVKLETWNESVLEARSRLLSFYQDILDFLVYLIDAEWFSPYVPYFEEVELTLVRDVQDDAGRISVKPFYRINARKGMIRRARKGGVDPFHLDRSFEVAFNGGRNV